MNIFDPVLMAVASQVPDAMPGAGSSADSWALFQRPGVYFLLKWFHFLAGITWIGMLYYFNFVQTPFFKGGAPKEVSSGMLRGLVPNALWWFRWGAMFTFITGWTMIMMRLHGDKLAWDAAWSTKILTGALMGTFMWFNVWFIIWPAQKVVIASAEKVAGGGDPIPEAAARGARAGLASRTNTLLSFPMLFFMGAATNLSVSPDNTLVYWLIAGGLIVLFEINGLMAPGKPTQRSLGSVSGTIHMGLLLTAVLYVVLEMV